MGTIATGVAFFALMVVLSVVYWSVTALLTRMIRGPARMRVLAATVDPRTTYEIEEVADVGVGRLWPLLSQLEYDGLVRSDWRPGPYPRKRVYEITDTGFAELEQWLTVRGVLHACHAQQ